MEQSMLIQATDGVIYRDPFVDFGTVGIFVRDGTLYVGVKDYKNTSVSSARIRASTALKGEGKRIGKVAKEGEITMGLLGSELVRVWAFELILDSPIPVPTTFSEKILSVSLEKLLNPVELIICFWSWETTSELLAFYKGGQNDFLTLVMGGTIKTARLRLGRQFPWLKSESQIGNEVVLKWANNYFGYCESIIITD